MDISPFIQTTFGAIVGGGVVVATNWIGMQREKRKAVQEWYEQRYITEGVDCLNTYFTSLLFTLLKPRRDGTMLFVDIPVPIEALTRIEFLLGMKQMGSGGAEVFGVLITMIHNCSDSKSNEQEEIAFDAFWKIFPVLFELRQEILTLIPNKIRRKSQRLELSKYGHMMRSIIEVVFDRLDKLNSITTVETK